MAGRSWLKTFTWVIIIACGATITGVGSRANGVDQVAEPKLNFLVSSQLDDTKQSEVAIPCKFHGNCYCRYDQATELHFQLEKLWYKADTDERKFLQSVSTLTQQLQADATTYAVTNDEMNTLAQDIINSSYSWAFRNLRLFQHSPVYEFLCTSTPISTIPTEYVTRGVISHVSITGSLLGFVNNGAFADRQIQNLQLSSNSIYHISEHAFSSMKETLSVLDLSSNNLDEVPLKSLRSLKILEWLNLSDNLLVSMGKDWLSLRMSLRQLSLAGNKIQILPKNMLLSFTRLIWMDLSLNCIQKVEKNMLPSNIQTLILRSNKIMHFPMSILDIGALSWLILNGCLIKKVPTNWPHSSSRLMNQLDLSENLIQVWPSRPFSGRLRVLDLDLSKNNFIEIPADAFHSMATYRLSLGYNGINKIHTNAFSTLQPSLKYLNLENNQLRSIPWKSLYNLTHLVYLYVGGNGITDELIGFPSSGDCNLMFLGLNSNHIRSIPKRLMVRCSNLVHLNLGYNHILHLEPFAHFRSKGVKFEKLSTLILRNNPIHSLRASEHRNRHNHAHYKYKSTLALSILNEEFGHQNDTNYARQPSNWSSSGNSGKVDPLLPRALRSTSQAESSFQPGFMSSNVFQESIFPNLYELSLSFCRLSGELPTFHLPKLTNLEISMGLRTAVTLRASIFNKMKSLEWLALDHNGIKSIQGDTFQSNRNLTYLNLEWNKIESVPGELFHLETHPAISTIRLSHNALVELKRKTFLTLPSISLDLSYNKIRYVGKFAFTEDSPKFLTPSAAKVYPGSLSLNASTTTNSVGVRMIGATPISGISQDPQFPGITLHLSHNHLTSIPSEAFSHKKYMLVDLSYNKLVEFNFNAFSKGRTELNALNVSCNHLRKLESETGAFRFMSFLDASHNQLKENKLLLGKICVTNLLDLSYNKMSRLFNHFLPSNCSLTELKLSWNDVSSLDSESFSNLPDLTTLHLNRNKISVVPPIPFIRNVHLKYLDLSHNFIHHLQSDSLVGTSIQILLLNHNQFRDLPVYALSQIGRSLKRLDLSENAIEHLDSTMFEAMFNLVYLNLSYNLLNILPDNVFSYLRSLIELDLSYNAITANYKELFHFLPMLNQLRLRGCGIKRLANLPLPHLTSLDLSSNELLTIEKSSFESLSRLQQLDLSNNGITLIDSSAWGPLKNLAHLKISGNPIKSISEESFVGLRGLENLEILDLQYLRSFHSDSIAALKNLKKLSIETYAHVNNNRFHLGSLLSKLNFLQDLKILVKESRLSTELKGSGLKKLKRLTITGSKLKEIEPEALDELQHLFSLDLAIRDTSIKEISSRTFQIFKQADWLRVDLSQNQFTTLQSSTFYPNGSMWFAKGTKIFLGGLILDGNPWKCNCELVWVGEWLRRWLRESFASHSTSISRMHEKYEMLAKATCYDSNSNQNIPLIELHSDIMCRASALSGSSRTFQLPGIHQITFFLTLTSTLFSREMFSNDFD